MPMPYSPETTFEGFTYRVKSHPSDHQGNRKWELQLKLGQRWTRAATTTLAGTATWKDAYKNFGLEVSSAG